MPLATEAVPCSIPTSNTQRVQFHHINISPSCLQILLKKYLRDCWVGLKWQEREENFDKCCSNMWALFHVRFERVSPLALELSFQIFFHKIELHGNLRQVKS